MLQDGTQAIRRAAAILQRIAQVGDGTPPSLRAISETVALPRSTTHRILKALCDTGLAGYDGASRSYRIGPLSYELGLAATDQAAERRALQEAVDRVAARTGVTSYLMRLSGIEAVCAHKAEGRALIRAIPVEVGQRRYLGVGAGATALLAEMGDATVDLVLGDIAGALAGYEDLSAEAVRAAVAETRTRGYAVSRGRVYASIFGLGVAMRRGEDRADAAISVAAHAPDVPPSQVEEWAGMIREEIARSGVRSAATPG